MVTVAIHAQKCFIGPDLLIECIKKAALARARPVTAMLCVSIAPTGMHWARIVYYDMLESR